MNGIDPPNWTLNSCFRVSRSVCMHFGLFCYCTKLDTKQVELAQLMQKLLPRSRIRIIRNERTQSTPFGNVSLLHETLFKTGWSCAINAQVRAMKAHRNFFATNAPEPPHWTLNSCIGAFRSVWVHFGLFHYCTKLGAKWAELVQLMQKFVPRSHVVIFRNER